ncbi:MAG: ornithine carbamoyltransferase [Granulosicoccaceae bacterium]
MRHFLSERDLTADEFRSVINRGSEFRRMWEANEPHALFPNSTLAMIFDKSSTRTRLSFEAGITQLGGKAINLSRSETQMGRGESLEDTARVLSQMVDLVLMRTFAHESIEQFASICTVPVMNGLTDLLHPCQMLADMQAYFDHRGDIKGKTVAWVGDGNNVCNSYINIADLLDFNLRVACPIDFQPDSNIIERGKSNTAITQDAAAACEGADLIVTDVWSSMGQEDEQAERKRAFADYCVTSELMALAAEDALFMHCLPAHRGEEVTSDVIDGPQSVVWEEAGNRMHAQKALMEFLLNNR